MEQEFFKKKEITSTYDLFQIAVPHHDSFQEQVFSNLVYLAHKTNISILEIGFGTGITTKKIMKAVPKAKITAVDISLDMFNTVSQDKHFSNICFILDDIYSYIQDIKENSFDAIVSAYTLHNIKINKRNNILSHLYRTLKQNGIFINADKYAHSNKETHNEAFNWQLNNFKKLSALGYINLEKEWTQHYIKDNDTSYLLEESQFENFLLEMGFRTITKTYREQLEAVFVALK